MPLREEPRANLVALVDEKYLYSIIKSAGFQSKGSQIAIVNSSLELITVSIEENLDQEMLQTILAEDKKKTIHGVNKFRIGRLFVFSSMSRVTDWNYLLFTPVNQISGKAASVRNLTIMICAVLTVICLLLALIISMNLYSPIREIINTIKNEPMTNQDHEAKIDEFNYILSHVKYVMERNKSLDNSMKQFEPAFRDYYLRSLILGIPNNMISESEYGFKLNWPYKNFSVIIVQISFEKEPTTALNNSRDPGIDDFLRYLEEVLHSNKGLLGVLTYIGKAQITILVNLNTQSTLRELLKEVDNQIGLYADKYRCSITLGVGGLCKAMSQINGSYEQALKAIRFRKITEKCQVIYFNKTGETKSSKFTLFYPIDQERQLIYKVIAGEYEKVVEVLNVIIANNIFRETTYDQLITVFDQFIGTAGKILNKEKTIKQSFEEKELLDFYRNNKPDNLMDMRRGVLEIYRQITEAFSKKKNGKSEDLKEKLIQYIQENYHVPNISLDSIANEFDLNPKYVSRYFKEQTGTNYIDYLNMVRVNEAKRLLAQEKKLKIHEISKIVGFYSVNTFIAAFRRAEGITPGLFRKLSRV